MPVIGVITARTLRCPSSARSTLKKINNKMLLYTASVSIRPSVPHDRAMAQNESVSEANFTPRLRVLVADDHRDTVLRLGILLRSEGYDVRLAENGAQALAEAAQFHPDVALLDIEMPHRNGFEVADELRRRDIQCPVLIAVTSHTSSADRQMAESSGFHHFMAKPFDPQALLLLLDSLSPQYNVAGLA